MKRTSFYIVIVFFLVFSSCENSENPKFNWLLGKWELMNDSQAKTYENWIFDEGVYSGHGFVMVENDTVWQEQMTLQKVNGNYVLRVNNPEHQDFVEFAMISSTDTSFVVENQANEFPQVIKYWRGNNSLNAEISNKDKKVSFLFKPLKFE